MRDGAYVYLAGPIAGVRRWQAREWRKRVAETIERELPHIPVAFFDPANCYSVTESGVLVPALIERIQGINDASVLVSDIVVAQVLPEIYSKGTDHEIHLAMKAKKPLIVFGSIQRLMFARVSGLLGDSGERWLRCCLQAGSVAFHFSLNDMVQDLLSRLTDYNVRGNPALLGPGNQTEMVAGGNDK